MLEIKNVTKIYKTKGGVDTKALDGVTISFGETGLVFLLGKSGSGKSTLLNVCGGLDEPTSGEVVVMGKSSKDFSGSDFDSYRNTFVGFIFQEYNVLDEFNVEDNIALALELQGKPKDKQKITKLLQEVELGAFAKRKPNTLSGGQKQRIAIARALIKEPQIIMADEPTGALDSATGKQVFDTLKKLSKTRLVIVVSHDREFAEVYGDRIVELKDGKIISDVSKSEIPPETLDDNVTVVGGSTLSIKSGSKLTESNLKTIQDFVLSSEGDVIITKGDKEITSFKKANRMTDSGATETFNATDTENIALKDYTQEDSKFIRSRLPAGKAIKIGASGLKLKPVRLVFTILLSFIAFTMFGLFSTLMLYDGDRVTVKSYMQSDYDFLNLTKNYLVTETNEWDDGSWSNTYERSTKFTQEEIDSFSEKYGDSTFGYFSSGYGGTFGIDNITVNNERYYSTQIDKFACIPKGHRVIDGLTGSYPTKADEICISSYLADLMLSDESTVFEVIISDGNEKPSYDKGISLNSRQDILNKNIVISFNGDRYVFKVTGIFNSGDVSVKYDRLKEYSNNDFLLYYEYMTYLEEGMHRLVLVSEDFYSLFENYFVAEEFNYVNYFNNCNNQFSINYSDDYFDGETGEWGKHDTEYYFSFKVGVYAQDNKLKSHFFGGTAKNSLADNEIIIGTDYFRIVLQDPLIDYFNSQIEAGAYDEEEEVKSAYQMFEDFMYKVGTYRWNYGGVSNAERLQILDEITEVLNNIQPFDIDINIDYRTVKCRIVGFHEDDIISDNDSSYGIYVAQSFIDNNNLKLNRNGYETKYVKEEGAIYSGIYIAYDKGEKEIRDVLNSVGVEHATENDVVYRLSSSLYNSISEVNFIADILSTVFLWIGLIFAAFSALLMFNFISVSISSKRKEIGILRAVGARGTDVFKIFFSEAGIIVGICTVLAVIGTIVGCALINGILKANIGLEVTMFVFGFPSFAIMVGIALLVAFIATFLPVYFAARKKPVDSIRAL